MGAGEGANGAAGRAGEVAAASAGGAGAGDAGCPRGEARRGAGEGAGQPESGLDWNRMWVERFGCDPESDRDNEAYWDERAESFGCHAASGAPAPGGQRADDDSRATTEPSPYAAEYLRLAGLRPGESAIDMGCGTGSIALPAAGEGHRVTACDLSECMLARLRARARAAGVADMVDARKLSWLGDWSGLPVADVFLASRSLYSCDLRATLLAMEAHARRRCCVTVATLDSPLHDRTMLEAIGRPMPRLSEHVYLFNLLAQMGRLPEVSYIEHVKPTFGDTPQQVTAEFERDAGPMTDEERDRLARFVASRFDFDRRTPQGHPTRSYRQVVRWAFVAWDVPKRSEGVPA